MTSSRCPRPVKVGARLVDDDGMSRDDHNGCSVVGIPERPDASGRPSWSDADQAEMAAHRDGMEALAQRFAAAFVCFFDEHPALAELVRSHMSLDEHRRLVAEHVRSLLDDPRSPQSVASSTDVGYAHIRAGVMPSAYLSAYNLLFPSYHQADGASNVELPALGTLRRRWLLDVCASLDSYHDALAATWDSERTRLEASLRETETRATQDDLTGVLRREPFVRIVEASRRRGLLLVIDLDDFKALNDRHGHLAGDRALAGVGAALKDNVRGHEAVARLGGDEFGIWIEQEAGVEVAVALVHRVEQALPLAEWDVGISGGCVACPAGPRDFLDLYRQADMAMYRAKRTKMLRGARSSVLAAPARRAGSHRGAGDWPVPHRSVG